MPDPQRITFPLVRLSEHEAAENTTACFFCGLQRVEWLMRVRPGTTLGVHEACRMRHESGSKRPSGEWKLGDGE